MCHACTEHTQARENGTAALESDRFFSSPHTREATRANLTALFIFKVETRIYNAHRADFFSERGERPTLTFKKCGQRPI